MRFSGRECIEKGGKGEGERGGGEGGKEGRREGRRTWDGGGEREQHAEAREHAGGRP